MMSPMDQEDTKVPTTSADDDDDDNEALVNNQEHRLTDATASVTQLTHQEFNRPELIAKSQVPVIVKGFSVKKTVDYQGSCCGGTNEAPHDNNQQGLQLAPNFASVILGRWLAGKLGLGGKRPTMTVEKSMGVASDTVVSNVNALLRPGEGTLVLGPSSSGKTTLMRSMADKLEGKIPANDKNYQGTILIGSVDPSECDNSLSRTTSFADQGDLSLTPILTVGETLLFARNCADGDSDRLEETVDALLKLTGLDHVKSTVVGDADIRGVSGGQKRRVKVLEMAVGIDVYVSFFDAITNGLDAASALNVCKVLKTALETTGSIGVTSLLQPSVEVFHTFQNLILLTQDGQVAYSGPTKDAVDYFEGLGLAKPNKMNAPEFLLRCTSSPEEFWDQEAGGPLPDNLSTSSGFAKTFEESEAGRSLIELLDQVAKEQLESGEVGRAAATKKVAPFALPMHRQVSLLVSRGWKLITRNPASFIRIVSALIFGAFIGTLFLNTADDADGTRVRAGYVLTLLFLSFLNSSMAPLEELFRDRDTFYIHRKASFYRTSSYYLSQVICQVPVALAEAFFLCVLSFFAVGMNHVEAWQFFYFWLEFSLLTLNGLSISRVLAFSLPANDVAQTLGPAVLLLFILSTGNAPQYLQLPVWLRWLSWISPCAYAYEGVLINEVFGRDVGNQSGIVYAQEQLGIPRIPYTTAASGLSSEGLVMAFDAYMLIIITAFFDVCACVLLHQSQKWYGPSTQRYQVASGMSLKAAPFQETDAKRVNDSCSLESNEKAPIPPAPKAHLTARNIVYEVDVPINPEDDPKKEEQDEDISMENETLNGSIDEDEEEHALITARSYGQTGRGMATEWVLKRRIGEDAVSDSPSKSLSVASSIVSHQEEPAPGRLRLLNGITCSFEPGTLTALMGSSGAGKSTLLDVLAGYKTGGHVSGEININGKAKTEGTWRSIAGYCEQVDLHNPVVTVRESIIFSARMRLRPSSIPDDDKIEYADSILKLLDLEDYGDMLVGDEAAGEGVPKHARKRLTVGVELAANPSILFADEPTSGLDSLSAAVVVSSLKRAAAMKGLSVVCTIHQPSREVFETFDNLLLLKKGGVCVYNGGLDALQEYIGERFPLARDANPADHVLDVFCGPLGDSEDWAALYSKSSMAEAALLSHTVCPCDACSDSAISVDTSSLALSAELFLVGSRQLLVHWRTPSYMVVRFLWTVVASLLVGLVYLGEGKASGLSAAFNVSGSIFFFVNIATVPLLSAMVPLITERAIFYREVASGTYRKFVYGIAVQFAELPFNLLAGAISFLIFYFLVGLKLDGERVVYFLLMTLAAYWLIPSLGQLVAFISPNLGSAVGIGSLAMTLFTLTMGFLIPPGEIPPWYIWIYWINPLRYILQGLVVNQNGGSEEGEAFLGALTWSYDERWWYCYVAVLLFACAGFTGIVLSTRISWLKR